MERCARADSWSISKKRRQNVAKKSIQTVAKSQKHLAVAGLQSRLGRDGGQMQVQLLQKVLTSLLDGRVKRHDLLALAAPSTTDNPYVKSSQYLVADLDVVLQLGNLRRVCRHDALLALVVVVVLAVVLILALRSAILDQRAAPVAHAADQTMLQLLADLPIQRPEQLGRRKPHLRRENDQSQLERA